MIRGPSETDFVRVFNKTDKETVWMNEAWESPVLTPMTWTDRVPVDLARQFGANGEFSVDWRIGERKLMRPQPLHTPDGQTHLLVASQLDPVSGYGYLSQKLVEEMGRVENLKLTMHSLGWSSRTPQPVRDLLAQPQEPCQWALAVTIPTELANIPSQHVILYTMWETRELPHGDHPDSSWANQINNWAEAIVVPCEEQADIYRVAGVTKPIYVVGIGVDTEVYRQLEDVERDDVFSIWTHGRLTSRKSPMELLTEVVWPALGHLDDWQLTLKTWMGTLGGGQHSPIIQDDRVHVVDAILEADEMNRRMNRAHVGVYLSKFEGWGMPWREAMASGMVTVASETSGHVVDCDPNYNFPVPIVGTAEAGDGYAGTWDLPDYEYARTIVRGLYDAWRGGWDHTRMGYDAAQWIRSRRNWRRMAQDILEIVDEVQDRVEAGE